MLVSTLQHVYSILTESGSRLDKLAELYFDGRIDALAQLPLLTPTATEPLNPPALDVLQQSADYETFVEYMRDNKPCIIKDLTKSWPATSNFVSECATEGPDMAFVGSQHGHLVAPVYVTTKRDGNCFGALPRPHEIEQTVSEYCDWWALHHEIALEEQPDPVDLHYLKDWNFSASFPADNIYSCPSFFREDWLNEAVGSYRFLYCGPAGTSTRLHADVLQSYSWSANVVGTKRWYLLPPQYTYLLYDVFGQRLAPHFHSDTELEFELLNMFPGLKEARKHAYCVVQRTGETIFVPSGWHHTVENLEDTLSINHNWLNGFNLTYAWAKLKTELVLLQAQMKSERGDCGDAPKDEWVKDEGAAASVRRAEQDTLAAVGDLLLLYKVVAHQLEKKDIRLLRRRDLITIETMLTGVHEFVEDGDLFGVRSRTEYIGAELLEKVQGRLFIIRELGI